MRKQLAWYDLRIFCRTKYIAWHDFKTIGRKKLQTCPSSASLFWVSESFGTFG